MANLSQCIIALIDIHTGITQILHVNMTFYIHSSSGHQTLCVLTFTGFTVEFGKK